MNTIYNSFIVRYLWSQLFLFCVLFSLLNPIWVHISFRMNQEYIARELCVKREIQGNTCQGKCHLKKQLQSSTEEDSQRESKIPKLKIVPSIYVVEDLGLSCIDLQRTIETRHYFQYNSPPACKQWAAGVFHPPQESNS